MGFARWFDSKAK
jgi:hypothetical protein